MSKKTTAASGRPKTTPKRARSKPRAQKLVPKKILCPHCQSDNVWWDGGNGAVRYYRCQRCTPAMGPKRFRVIVDMNLISHIDPAAWKGEEVILFGGGPSAGRFDLRRLRGRKVITCNDAWNWLHRIKRAPHISFSADQLWMKQAAKNKAYLKATGMRVAGDDSRIKIPPSFLRVPLEAAEDFWGEDLSEGLQFGGNTGCAALNLADALGASRIYMVGFDLNHKNWRGVVNEDNRRRDLHGKFRRVFEAVAPRIRAEVYTVDVSPPIDGYEVARHDDL